MLSFYSLQLSEKEINQIKKETREIKRFFFYICLMLATQSVNLIVVALRDIDGLKEKLHVTYDTVNTLANICYILMYFGISNSVKMAYEGEQRKKKMTVGGKDLTTVGVDSFIGAPIDP